MLSMHMMGAETVHKPRDHIDGVKEGDGTGRQKIFFDRIAGPLLRGAGRAPAAAVFESK